MSRLGLKMFIIILLTAVGALIIASILVHFTVNRQFQDYLYSENRERLQGLVELIEENYREYEDWNRIQELVVDFMRTNHMRIQVIDDQGELVAPLEQQRRGMMQHGLGMMRNRDGWPEDFSREGAASFELTVEGKEIGVLYWERPPGTELLSSTARRFMENVNRVIILTAVIVILLTVIISYFLSRYLTRPLLAMKQVANRVAEGDFKQQVQVRGQDEIAELGHSFNEMVTRLDHLETIRRESTSDLAHELRTPVTTIKSYLEGFADGVLEINDQNLKEMDEELERMIRLINRLGELGEAEKKTVHLEKVQLDLKQVLKVVTRHFQPLAREQEISLDLSLPADNLILMGDRDSLEAVFNNLLSNALKYTPAGGRVSIEAVHRHEIIRVSVADTGIGIPEEDLPFIFERFYRTDKSRSTKTGGTGIGLTIARELVKAHDGEIYVESSDRGTTFYVKLPTG
ncbi:MAG: sensor histidine kinase [Bacillota bacterium]